jgi:hypothetical protein
MSHTRYRPNSGRKPELEKEKPKDWKERTEKFVQEFAPLLEDGALKSAAGLQEKDEQLRAVYNKFVWNEKVFRKSRKELQTEAEGLFRQCVHLKTPEDLNQLSGIQTLHRKNNVALRTAYRMGVEYEYGKEAAKAEENGEDAGSKYSMSDDKIQFAYSCKPEDTRKEEAKPEQNWEIFENRYMALYFVRDMLDFCQKPGKYPGESSLLESIMCIHDKSLVTRGKSMLVKRMVELMVEALSYLQNALSKPVKGFDMDGKGVQISGRENKPIEFNMEPVYSFPQEFDVTAEQERMDVQEMLDKFESLDLPVHAFVISIKYEGVHFRVTCMDDYCIEPYADEKCYVYMEDDEDNAVLKHDERVSMQGGTALFHGMVNDAVVFVRILSILREQIHPLPYPVDEKYKQLYAQFKTLRLERLVSFEIEGTGLQRKRKWALMKCVMQHPVTKEEKSVVVKYVLAYASVNVLRRSPTTALRRRAQQLYGGTNIGNSLVQLRGKFAEAQSLLLLQKPVAVSVKVPLTASLPKPLQTKSVEVLEEEARQLRMEKEMSTRTLSIRESQIVAAAHAKKLLVSDGLLQSANAAAGRVFQF